jgi:ABC-type nitrate/sulfonate/bicarbonate transport system substrate-binding protein
MASLTKLRLIQFRAGYNLPVHAGREQGIFERHGLEIEITYTPGSLYISDALRKGNSRLATRAPTISSPMWKISAAVLRASLSSWDSIAAS